MLPDNRKIVSVNKGWYSVYGQEDAPAVVLLHGSVVTRVSWLPQIDALSPVYRLIVPDLPAHGALKDVPFKLYDTVERIIHLVDLESHEQERVALVGISLGGHVATLAAARLGERVAGLVITGASTSYTGVSGWWMRLVGRQMLRTNEEKLRAQVTRSVRAKWPGKIGEAVIAGGLYPYGSAQPFVELPKVDFKEVLARVTAPVLIMNGELDRPYRRGEKSFAQAARNARLEVIPGAGHACPIEQPEIYNRVLRAFFAGLDFKNK